MKTIKSVFNKLGKFFGKVWQIFTALLIAPWRLDYKSDDFEEDFSIGPFILSYDVVTEWILFIRQREPGYHVVVFEIPTLIMNILYRLGQLKFKMALGYLFAFLLDTFAEVVSRGHWQFGHTHINYKDGEGWSFHRHPELRWRFNILGFNVGKGGIYLLRKCWSCDRRDFLRQNFRSPAECVSKSHECDHCFVLSDEQYYKQLELTPSYAVRPGHVSRRRLAGNVYPLRDQRASAAPVRFQESSTTTASIDSGLYLKFQNKWRIIKMSPKTNEGDEYDLPPVNRPKVKRAQWNKVHEALIAVEESEADFGRPIGNHYKLQLVLYELGCGLIHDKKEMKRIAQEIIDNGYI